MTERRTIDGSRYRVAAAITDRYGAGESAPEIAHDFGLTVYVVELIVTASGDTWEGEPE